MSTHIRIPALPWPLLALLLVATGVAASATTAVLGQDRGTDRVTDHIANGSFMVEIEGVVSSSFTVVGGIESSVEVIAFRDGADRTVRKRPGRTSFGNVTLRRGYTASPELWQWYKQVMDGAVERKAMSIILLNSAGGEIERYNCFEAWPVRYLNYELDSNRPGVVTEEIEIAVERIERG